MSEVPNNIKREHILGAIERIDREGVPSRAGSSSYDVIHKHRRYPPKLVISYANFLANGEELDRKAFEGGDGTECFDKLRNAGFDIVEKDRKSYWFVGATFDDVDQSERFIAGGIWEHGFDDKYIDQVKRIKEGERIAIKAPYTKKHELPFDANGKTVSVMAIKAIGTVSENPEDGRTLKVDWVPLSHKKEWYFYTNQRTVWEVKPGEKFCDDLIAFTFYDAPQDYDFFKNSSYWRDRFGERSSNGNYQIAENPRRIAEMEYPLNQILYGPPGTGKTYHTINQALAILDPEFAQAHEGERLLLKQRFDALREQGRIFFVTFHQSFSYEDFVEGIKASTNEGSVHYAVEPGVFKDACNAASTKPGGQSVDEVIAQFLEEITDNPITLKTRTGKEFEASYKEGLSSITCRPKEAASDSVHRASIDLIKQVLRGHHPKEVYNRSYVKGIAVFLKERLEGDQPDFYIGQQFKDYRISGVSSEIVEITKPNDKVLPFPRVVIDTLAEKVKAGVLTIDAIKNKEWQSVAPSIEPFLVNGYSNLVPMMVDYLVQGMGPKPQVEQGTQPVVLIMDEINRGNISSIFGELITLIEPSKRAGASEALSVTLPYSKEVFQVPKNLYLIGTMNTADRSLALMDTALRRRFEFVEMMPQPELLDDLTIKGIDVATMLRKMNQRIELLYDREHTLGHALFMHLLDMEEDSAFDALRTVFENKVLPLLEEYFFEDWEKIRLVLADNQKRDTDHQFVVIDESTDSSDLFGRDAELGYDDEGLKSYRRNATALALPEAYIAIYES